jgi:ABC-type transport system substrate-binding protein
VIPRTGWRVAAALGLAAACVPAAAADPSKVLRYAFEIAETTLDPAKVTDVYSNTLMSHIFEAPLDYDYLARPLKMVPVTLESMPQISADGKTYVLKVKPGTYFTDDPAFEGKRRELVAEDFVYSMKRLIDPKLAAPLLSEIEDKIVGVEEAAIAARKANRFDYDAPIEGLRALDRYTWQIKLREPFYNFIYNLADCRVACVVAREVVEKYGDDVGAHPVGTGPYRLVSWKRSAKLVLEANAGYREVYFDGHPPADDVRGQATLAHLKGKRLPLIGRVEISIIDEAQPRWLSFVNGEFDLIYRVPEEFALSAMPNNRIAPSLAKKGIVMEQVPGLDLTFNYFNMDDPMVGGYTPEKVALRRAVSLAYKVQDEIAIVRKNQAIAAQAPYSPGVAGYDPAFRTSASEYDLAKAKALLDMFGYVDRDGDGYREMPDGSRLEIKANSTPTARDQQLDELWKRSMDDVGIRISFRKAKWPDLLKESDAGKLMMWQLGGSAAAPDADTWLQTLYGPNAGYKGNRSRFRLAEYDRLYERARVMPDSPERTRLYQQMAKIIVAYAPLKINTHRIITDMWFPQLLGYHRPLLQGNPFWQYLDIDNARRQ